MAAVVLLVLGAILVSVGAAWVYMPAGPIVAGLFLVAAGVDLGRP